MDNGHYGYDESPLKAGFFTPLIKQLEKIYRHFIATQNSDIKKATFKSGLIS